MSVYFYAKTQTTEVWPSTLMWIGIQSWKQDEQGNIIVGASLASVAEADEQLLHMIRELQALRTSVRRVKFGAISDLKPDLYLKGLTHSPNRDFT